MFGIRAGAAFDGEQAVPRGALVLLDGGRIAGVQPGAAPAPDGCEVLEVSSGTILPGLVDAHVNLCADGTDGSLDRIQEPNQDGMMAVISQSLRTHLAAGVTTVRDLGDRRFAVLDWRASARDAGYPAVVASGPPITSVGGHCADMGGEEQPRAAVRERAARGADIVKIMTGGGFATAGTQVMLCQFTLGELQAVVDEAHAAALAGGSWPGAPDRAAQVFVRARWCSCVTTQRPSSLCRPMVRASGQIHRPDYRLSARASGHLRRRAGYRDIPYRAP